MVRVETDAGSLTRLLLHRLDVTQAVEEGRVVVRGGEEAVRRVSAGFGWAPWVFHMLDYI